MRLGGEVAIVTGSTSGLGVAIAERFAAEGASVVVTGRSAERGARVADAIAAAGGSATFVPADLTDEAAAALLVAAAVERFGALTVLVNNAVANDGRGDGTVLDVETATWERVLRVNLLAPAWLCRAAIPQMRRAGRGSIVNISSRAARRGTPGVAAYSASKGGLDALTRAVAVDHAADGVRANLISVGYVLHERRDAELDDERRRQLEAMHLTRVGTAADVAHAAVYLASQESAFMTGATLALDGGSTAARARALG